MLSFVIGLMFLSIHPVYADNTSLSLDNLYINPITQTLPEAIIIHNSNNPCQTCNQAIDMIIALLKKHYRNKLHAYLIDIAYYPQYASFFDIKQPLSLVVVRINDHAAFGFSKLNDLPSLTTDKQEFDRRVQSFINNFLGLD